MQTRKYDPEVMDITTKFWYLYALSQDTAIDS